MIPKRKKTFVLLLLILGSLHIQAQNIAINNNLFFDAIGSISAGLEIPTSKKTSFEAYGSFRPWKRGDISVHKHWTAQAQYRYYTCQVMNGFFVGPYIHGGQFNFGNETLPFNLLKGLGENRYEGWFAGGGIGIGYEYVLAKHWSLGAEIGAGYTHIRYKKYDCEVCAAKKENDKYNYFGINRIGLSIIYVF